jgi:hypothetical protein
MYRAISKRDGLGRRRNVFQKKITRIPTMMAIQAMAFARMMRFLSFRPDRSDCSIAGSPAGSTRIDSCTGPGLEIDDPHAAFTLVFCSLAVIA